MPDKKCHQRNESIAEKDMIECSILSRRQTMNGENSKGTHDKQEMS